MVRRNPRDDNSVYEDIPGTDFPKVSIEAELLNIVSRLEGRNPSALDPEKLEKGIAVLIMVSVRDGFYAIIHYPRLPWNRLSKREQHVVYAIREGCSTNKEIAMRLEIKLSSLPRIFDRIYTKLDIHSRMELMLHIYLENLRCRVDHRNTKNSIFNSQRR